ncbi:hypothetical protein [Sphingomonas sp. TDK1]|uniref:hypothetical protein n=1 Tax=Sphingomonas sp. TDK1 TaxID=453247 RepID=UPI0007D9E735|nr:hypothetical protein [Sphingomonas sp. TDK1]OAN63540.1 hypothetical protein A7X12_19955 [Sphingomonas sp. TDK1]
MGIHEPPVEADQTVQAFNDMSRKLAGLTAAVDGFAARQQELHARDYGPDLEKIRDGYRMGRLRMAARDKSCQPNTP